MKRFWNKITEKSLSPASLLDDIVNWNLIDIKQQCDWANHDTWSHFSFTLMVKALFPSKCSKPYMLNNIPTQKPVNCTESHVSNCYLQREGLISGFTWPPKLPVAAPSSEGPNKRFQGCSQSLAPTTRRLGITLVTTHALWMCVQALLVSQLQENNRQGSDKRAKVFLVTSQYYMEQMSNPHMRACWDEDHHNYCLSFNYWPYSLP